MFFHLIVYFHLSFISSHVILCFYFYLYLMVPENKRSLLRRSTLTGILNQPNFTNYSSSYHFLSFSFWFFITCSYGELIIIIIITTIIIIIIINCGHTNLLICKYSTTLATVNPVTTLTTKLSVYLGYSKVEYGRT
jgi:hypothetical protein